MSAIWNFKSILVGIITLTSASAFSANSCEILFEAEKPIGISRTLGASQFKTDYILPALRALRSLEEGSADLNDSHKVIDQFDYGTISFSGASKYDSAFLKNATSPTAIQNIPFPVFYEGGPPKPLQTVDVTKIIETSIAPNNGDSTYSRLVFYGGDIYSANYYRNFAFGKKYTGDGLREFIQNQAWLERTFDPQENEIKYIVHSEHAGRRILERFFSEALTDEVTLYRGGFKGEFLLFQMINHLLAGQEIPSERIDEILRSINSGSSLSYTFNDLKKFKKNQKNMDTSLRIEWGKRFLQQYALANRKIFMSASEKEATRFTRGSVIAITFTKSDLMRLYNEGNLYVGIEGQIEFSFFDQPGILSLMQKKMNVFEPRYDTLGGFMESDYHNPLFNY